MGEIYFMRKYFLLVLCSIFLISCSSKDNETMDKNDTLDKTNEQKNLDENGKIDGEAEETFAFPTGELQKGDKSEDVTHLQLGLKDIGYPIEETGTFDD